MKILYVTTIGATMSFFKDFIKDLILDGHCVDIATNDSTRKPPECYYEFGCRVFTLSCTRSPLDKENITAIGQIRRLVEREKYDIVHCHTPIAATCTRIACRKLRKKNGVKVFYTAHGFHFYKGAPLLNWLVFYPVEKVCSRFTDKLITINQEDYARAKAKFHAGEVCYVPGVGIDLSRFENVQVDRASKRREIGIPEDAILLLSVGELNKNKNHQIVVKALAKLNDPNVHYAIAGVGDKREHLLELAQKLGVSDRLHLLGYRKDIPELNHVADVFCFPSFREGLSVSLIEAMSCGLPAVCSHIRGNTDLIDENGGYLFDPHDLDNCCRAITHLLNSETKQAGKVNQSRAIHYSTDRIIATMKSIYES